MIKIMHLLNNSKKACILIIASVLFSLFFVSCSTSSGTRHKMVVSVSDQKMMLLKDGTPVKTYKVSTSKFGLGSKNGSNRTPLGKLGVAQKIGGSSPSGMVFKSRQPTGEVIKPNAPGRDPIVSRIIRLYGKDSENKNTYSRCVYIHGTPEEYKLGQPASYGCIRMSSHDVIDLYNRIGVGSEVQVTRGRLNDIVSHNATPLASLN
jgi:lipoprotein-anchoring transpeptidase ErfK/SrfK